MPDHHSHHAAPFYNIIGGRPGVFKSNDCSCRNGIELVIGDSEFGVVETVLK